MINKHKLTGHITLPIEMVVECDSTKIAPSELAENILLNEDNQFNIDGEFNKPLGLVSMYVGNNITESGAIEFNDIEEC